VSFRPGIISASAAWAILIVAQASVLELFSLAAGESSFFILTFD
jgi:hypothetical protein